MTLLRTVIFSMVAARVASTGADERFVTGTAISTAARDVSWFLKVVTTCASPSLRPCVMRSVTGCQMPLLRSRTPGIQSQPSVATKVGPSSAMAPPFSPGPPRMDCSCGMPGWGGGEMRTARTLFSAGLEHGGDVEAAAAECALHGAEELAVEPDRGGVVDAFEGQFGVCRGGQARTRAR